MTRTFVPLAASLLCVFAATSLAPAVRAQEAPKPGPEHKRLAYFVGMWKGEGEMKPGPMGPGGKLTSTETCEWLDGGFSVVCRGEGRTPMGPSKNLGIMGYSAEEKVYTYYGADNSPMTMTSVPRGTLKGDTWTYYDESMMGGQKVKSRVTIKELSPTAYAFTMDMQGPDGKWMPFMETKSTKVK